GHGRHHRTEWSAAGAAVHAIRRRDWHCPDQARWHSQGWRGGCYIARTRGSGALRGGGRKDWRPVALRSAGLRRFPFRYAGLAPSNLTGAKKFSMTSKKSVKREAPKTPQKSSTPVRTSPSS